MHMANKSFEINFRLPSSHNCTNALGKLNHGHSWRLGAGYRTPTWGVDEKTPSWEGCKIHHQDHVEEYCRTEHLSNSCPFDFSTWREAASKAHWPRCWFHSQNIHIQLLCVLPSMEAAFTSIFHWSTCIAHLHYLQHMLSHFCVLYWLTHFVFKILL